MGKGHKDRRREKRARDVEEQDKEFRLLKEELQEEEEHLQQERSLLRKQKEEQVTNEKSIESLSDTDSGHGTSTTTLTDSPKTTRPDTSTQLVRRKTSIKGLFNIGNTCFFNVVIQSLAHTPLLIDTLYRTVSLLTNGCEKKYSTTTTAQLVTVFDQFTSPDQKKASIDPKPLFNSLIQRVPTYKGYDQHDSHELFMNLMLILRAEEVRLRNLPNRETAQSENNDDPSKMFCLIGCNEPYTLYDSIFGGHLLDVITCQKCQKSLMKIEPFLGLLLPLSDRMSPTENYRNRRKREDYTNTKSKKENKTLSKKQQKALSKQEKKNQRRSVPGGSGKIRGRQAAKKKTVEEQLPLEEPPTLPSTEVKPSTNEDDTPKEPVDEQINPAVEPNDEEKPAVENEEEKPADENGDESGDEDNDEEEEEEEKVKGPLTATESTCTLADMVSKLTLIHETSSRPLPFVDQKIAEKFLNCSKTTPNSSETTETDNIKALSDCFQRYLKPEILSGENLFDCYYCRSSDPTQKRVLTEAVRQTVFCQLPPVLPIFLKRFQMYGAHSEKIGRFIEFPLELDLTDRCSSQMPVNSSTYSLYAVIEHQGTLRSGHYVTYVKQSSDDKSFSDDIYSKPIDLLLTDLFKTSTNKNTGKRTSDPSPPPASWYYISDNAIHKVPESKVLEANAYVLFYRRT